VVTTVNDSCTWNEAFHLPVQTPIISNVLKFSVWDEDADSDEQAGSIIFNVSELIKVCEGIEEPHFKWVNIYGAPG
jgi:hypothetical protein